jgi:uncharacterized protein
MTLVPTTLVLLKRPADPPAMSEAELDALQEQHLAHLAALKSAGKIAVSGPLGDQPDESWRGMCLYRTSIEESRELAEQDPSVHAGRLSVDVLTWWTQEGALPLGT